MLESLVLQNVGPAPRMALELGPRPTLAPIATRRLLASHNKRKAKNSVESVTEETSEL